jgi:hypothetical protein
MPKVIEDRNIAERLAKVLRRDWRHRHHYSESDCCLALMLPGLGARPTHNHFSTVKGRLAAAGFVDIERAPVDAPKVYVEVGYRGPFLDFDPSDTGHYNFAVFQGVIAQHLELRPNATSVVLIAHSAAGLIVSHCVAAQEIIPHSAAVHMIAFAAKLDMTPEIQQTMEGTEAVLLKAYLGSPEVLCRRLQPETSLTLWGDQDAVLGLHECVLPCIEPQIIQGADHQSILHNADAMQHVAACLERIDLRLDEDPSVPTA